MLILYSSTLQNVLAHSNFVLVLVDIHVTSKQQQFDFFFSPNDSLFFFLIVLARISGILLNKSGEREHPSLVLDLRKKSFQLVSFDFLTIILL